MLDARLPLHTGRTESHSWNWGMEFDLMTGVWDLMTGVWDLMTVVWDLMHRVWGLMTGV